MTTTTPDLLQHGSYFPFAEDEFGHDRCTICGRRLGKRPLYVEVVDGGLVHDPATGEADDFAPGYMGFYPVGSECAKRFRAGIAVRLDG